MTTMNASATGRRFIRDGYAVKDGPLDAAEMASYITRHPEWGTVAAAHARPPAGPGIDTLIRSVAMGVHAAYTANCLGWPDGSYPWAAEVASGPMASALLAWARGVVGGGTPAFGFRERPTLAQYFAAGEAAAGILADLTAAIDAEQHAHLTRYWPDRAEAMIAEHGDYYTRSWGRHITAVSQIDARHPGRR